MFIFIQHSKRTGISVGSQTDYLSLVNLYVKVAQSCPTLCDPVDYWGPVPVAIGRRMVRSNYRQSNDLLKDSENALATSGAFKQEGTIMALE